MEHEIKQTLELLISHIGELAKIEDQMDWLDKVISRAEKRKVFLFSLVKNSPD